MSIPAHPLAELFPMLQAADATGLRDDIASNGLRERIVIFDGQILDGRNRYRAAIDAGVLPDGLPDADSDLWTSHFRRFVSAQDGDPLAWVLSKNLHRRHLSESQRAMVAAKLESFAHGGARISDEQDANLRLDRKAAAEALHVSERSVSSAAKVRDRGAPELVRAVERGDVSVSAAEEAARTLSVGEQVRRLQEQSPREFARVMREERQAKQADKRERREQREVQLGARLSALPSKRYGVVLADPEWRFEPYSRETGMDRAADNHYPTSTLDVIKSRPVADIAADDCALLLWATVPMLPQALEVMLAWGFAYVSHAIWLKDRIGTGYWFRNQHEILLLGTRGNVPAPAMGTQYRSALAHDVGDHSAKPTFGHEIAEAYFPSLPKIELNARAVRPGWDAWGLEAPQDPGAVHEQAERIAMSFAEAEPILRARYATESGETLAAEIGRPIGTIRSWAHRLGLTDRGRIAGRGAAMVAEFNQKRGRT